jgi:electron transfer flavoprotein beta subunit
LLRVQAARPQKQVPDTAVERTLTAEGTLDRASLDGLIDELDEYAIEKGR